MKKFLTYSIVAATIAWSMGISAVLPAVASTGVVDGDIIKTATSNAVYYVAGGKKMLMVNRGTYSSWSSAIGDTEDKFAGLKVVSQADFDAVPYGANITVRPGTGLIKFNDSADIFAVGTGAKLYKLADAAAKDALYPGVNPVVIFNSFRANYYNNGNPVATLTASSNYPDGTFIKSADAADVYVLEGGLRRPISENGWSANGLKMSYVRTTNVTTYSTGAAVTGKEAWSSVTPSPAPVPVGNVTVALASDTPVSANIASGSAFNPVLKVNVTAGSAEASITGFTLKKSGFAANTAVSGVDVVDASGKRYGNVASSVNSDNEVNLIFTSNPIKIAAGQTMSLTFRVNIDAAVNSGTLQFGLASASAITAGGSVSGSFPVWGNTLSIIDGSNSLATVTLDVQNVNASGITLNVDETSAQDITKFRISETSSREAVRVKSLVLYNNGNAADADYKDVELVTSDGTVLATAQPAGQYITFSNLDYLIDKGLSKDLTVRAKIVGGTSRTIQLTVYNDYDLMVRGESTGVYVLAGEGSVDTTYPIGDVTTSYNKVTVGSGSVIFSKDSTSPNVAVAPGTSNTVLAKFAVKATGENMELRTVTLGIVPGGSNALTGSVYVKVDDASVWSASASSVSTSSAGATITLQSYPPLTSGKTHYITVVGSISQNATSSDSYRVHLNLGNVKRLLTNDIVDAGTAIDSGNSIAVQDATLRVTTLSIPVAQTTVNTNDFEFARIELNANNSGEDVRVSSLIISDVMGASSSASQISNLRLYNGDVLLETSNNTSAGAASSTFNLKSPIVVAKGGSVTLRLVANVSNAVGGSLDSHRFVVYSVTAVGAKNGNTVTPTYAGTGQTMTLATSGSATAALLSGVGSSPTSDQLINIGTTDGTYFGFKLTAINESLKMRTIKLTATSTATTKLSINDIRNIRLYANGSLVATANQMDSCTSGVCTITFTASDNLFGTTLVGTSAATAASVTVKADLGGAGIASLGNNFRFYISSSTTDLIGVGATSGASATITGTPTVSAVTYINPFVVTVSAVAPLTPQQVGTAAGITVGTFKVSNSGFAPITLTRAKFTDNGAATTTKIYHLYNSADGATNVNTSVATTSDADFTTSLTINGGSFRYLSIKMDNVSDNYDTYQLSANSSVGDFTFSVAESDLGYDANGDGDRNDTITGLGIIGNPDTETVTARN